MSTNETRLKEELASKSVLISFALQGKISSFSPRAEPATWQNSFIFNVCLRLIAYYWGWVGEPVSYLGYSWSPLSLKLKVSWSVTISHRQGYICMQAVHNLTAHNTVWRKWTSYRAIKSDSDMYIYECHSCSILSATVRRSLLRESARYFEK